MEEIRINKTELEILIREAIEQDRKRLLDYISDEVAYGYHDYSKEVEIIIPPIH
jgi:hypothetical protein